MPYERKHDELGSLWIKSSSRGEFMTGELEINGEKIPVVAFRNDRKAEGSKQPDWHLKRPRKREDQGTSRAAVTDRPDPMPDSEIPF